MDPHGRFLAKQVAGRGRSHQVLYLALVLSCAALICYNFIWAFDFIDSGPRRRASRQIPQLAVTHRRLDAEHSDGVTLGSSDWLHNITTPKVTNVAEITDVGLLEETGSIGSTSYQLAVDSPMEIHGIPSGDEPSNLYEKEIHVGFVAKYAYKKMKVIRNMSRCLGSILQHASVPLHVHVFLDKSSHTRVTRTLTKVAMETGKSFRISFHDIDAITKKFQPIILLMKKFFFTKDVGRYNDDIFFFTEILHWAFPRTPDRLIMIDLDLKFRADIALLHDHFKRFSETAVIGMAHDLQPHYRADFEKYRAKHPNTLVGAPRPGLQGFNTGVMLLDLRKMRDSDLYNSLLNNQVLKKLCDKYLFKGYLAHQDFFTLTGMEHPELYYVLDCSWNRQLDTGYLRSVGQEIFDKYHRCDGEIYVYHGNGDSMIPDD